MHPLRRYRRVDYSQRTDFYFDVPAKSYILNIQRLNWLPIYFHFKATYVWCEVALLDTMPTLVLWWAQSYTKMNIEFFWKKNAAYFERQGQ